MTECDYVYGWIETKNKNNYRHQKKNKQTNKQKQNNNNNKNQQNKTKQNQKTKPKKTWSHTQKVSPKMVNPTDIAKNAEEEEEEVTCKTNCQLEH